MTSLDLRQPAHRASSRARLFWTLRALPGWLVVLGVLLAALSGASVPGAVETALVLAALAVAVAHLAVMPQWRYRVHRWEITPDAVHTTSGWVTQERRIAPLTRVQTVDTHRGPLEQVFGLANVTITTASAKGPIKIHGLDLRVADEVAAYVTERAQASRGDGT